MRRGLERVVVRTEERLRGVWTMASSVSRMVMKSSKRAWAAGF